MRASTLLRITPGAWLTPAMAGVVLAYVVSTITFAHREPYALALTARSMNALGLIVPPFAAAAAWEGARLAGSGVWAMPMVRRRIVVGARCVSTAVVGGVIVIVVTAGLVVSHEDLWVPDPWVTVAAVAILVAQVSLGFAIGTRVRRAIAVPAVLVGSFLTFVLPRVAGSAWLRHLSGTSLELCCSTDDVLAPAMVVAILTGAFGLLVASAILVTRNRGARTDVAWAVLPVLGACVVAALIAPASVRPSIARADSGQTCAADTGILVCLWPEHDAMLGHVLDVAVRASAAWRAAGIESPRAFREGAASPSETSVRLSVGAGAEDDDLYADLAASIVQPFPLPGSGPDCAATEPWPSSVAAPYLFAFLASTAGMSRTQLADWVALDAVPDGDYFPDAPPGSLVPVRDVLDRVQRLPFAQRRQWARANLAAYRQCGVQAPLAP